MENYIDLSKLSRKGKYIDWSKSIGNYIHGVYDNEEFVVLIKDYNKPKTTLIVEYNNKLTNVKTGDFTNCRLGRVLGKITKDFKVEIGKIFKDDKRDLVITDREYRKEKHGKSIVNEKWYRCYCNKCTYEYWVRESSLLNLKTGCGACCQSPNVAVLGINTIWDNARWMCDLGVSEETAKNYLPNSNKKIEVVCVDCGKVKTITLSNLNKRKSISCKNCSDGKSYPEKFMISILSQLGIDFDSQLTKSSFTWCGEYKYDFYLPKYNMIIETHGLQHYEESSRKGARTLEEEQENDRVKEELALKNKIGKYLIIDCRYSEMEWIKNSVLNSELSDMFDLSNINWLKCEEFALSNLVKQVCNYWNNKQENETTRTLANIFSLNYTTIIEYLKTGTRLNWCYYDGKEEMKRCGNLRGTKINVYKHDKLIHTFNSIRESARELEKLYGEKMSNTSIVDRLNVDNKLCGKPYKGFTFKYATETEQNNQKESA